ncbi:conserved putative beta-mannosyltransferase [Saccharomycodes ludwigii]|uniref:conserved putative beta-mannosyltransferase n=1 Tax=Saccharomycodes ludwigii TaxID=36035 RepID=UPI001E8A2910|nr:conserved putative beta-mannosyltransferase [Saccharomycodes ludwigii]KAH3899600.1 conserved putative beta-mannosyltransferase [Saccharomycodes ludwigii]
MFFLKRKLSFKFLVVSLIAVIVVITLTVIQPHANNTSINTSSLSNLFSSNIKSKTTNNNDNNDNDNINHNHNNKGGSKKRIVVQSKKDLLNPSYLNSKKLIDNVDYKSKVSPNSPFSPFVNDVFTKYNVQGYISNPDNVDLSLPEYLLSESDEGSKKEKMCSILEYDNYFEYSYGSNQLILNELSDMKTLRDDLLYNYPKWFPFVQNKDTEVDLTEARILDEHWVRFGGSAVWLDEHQCYLMVSRVLYHPFGYEKHCKISLSRLELFDKDWNPLIGKRIWFSDISVNQADLDNMINKLDNEAIANVNDDPELKLRSLNRKKKFLNRYSVEFPTWLDIDMDLKDGETLGTEDPRVVLLGNGEPLVIFNMLDKDYNIDKTTRSIYSYFPFRKINPQLKFVIEGRQPKSVEKNWTPFLHRDDIEETVTSIDRGHLHFIYSFRPLEILKCSLNDGLCRLVFENQFLTTLDETNNEEDKKLNQYGGIRGGTQFLPLPSSLPQLSNGRQLWLGFPKLHIDWCGCGKSFYRPMLSLLMENDGVYSEELIVPILDFDMDVLSFDRKTTKCDGLNNLSPNSISAWDVLNYDTITGKYEDYLVFTMSEADYNTRRIVLKGVLNYVLEIYKNKEIKELFEITPDSKKVLQKALTCIVDYSNAECSAYGKAHPKD